MNSFYSNHPDVLRIALKAFPGYNGKKFKVMVTEGPINCASYWAGGSKDEYVPVRLTDEEAGKEFPAQSAFDPQVKGIDKVMLTPGLALVKHVFFCGKDMGLTIIVHPANAPKMLPQPVELSEDEKTCLDYTAGLKSSYGGIPNFRWHQANKKTGITLDCWKAAQVSLRDKKLLDARFAVTQEGRNQRSLQCKGPGTL